MNINCISLYNPSYSLSRSVHNPPPKKKKLKNNNAFASACSLFQVKFPALQNINIISLYHTCHFQITNCLCISQLNRNRSRASVRVRAIEHVIQWLIKCRLQITTDEMVVLHVLNNKTVISYKTIIWRAFFFASKQCMARTINIIHKR